MKHFAILTIALSAAAVVPAQTKFPFDSVSHEVVYNQSFKLSTKVKTEDVYAASLAWFGDPAKFTHKNDDPPIDTVKAKKNKRKAEAEEQFANPRPLQMQEPTAGKALGMGIMRYYGSMSGSIRLMYIKYDIAVRVKAGTATVSVSNIHYFHYNPSSYKQMPLYSFGGGKPCEEVGAIESLIGCENFRDEFKDMALYCNKEINGHFDDFKNLMKQKMYLYDPKAATAAPAKVTAKTKAKTTVKK